MTAHVDSMASVVATEMVTILAPQVGSDIELGIRAAAHASFIAGLELGLSFAGQHPREALRVLAEIEGDTNPGGNDRVLNGRRDLERQLLAASRLDA